MLVVDAHGLAEAQEAVAKQEVDLFGEDARFGVQG